jgi:outer membrane protein
MVRVLGIIGLGFGLGCMPAFAQESGFFVRGGPAAVIFSPSAQISVGGVEVPGASVDIAADTTLTFDIGYRFNETFTATFTGGLPPHARIEGTGPLAGAVLGTTRYAPAVVAVQAHVPTGSAMSPYVGAGVNYTIFYDVADGVVEGLDVRNAFAPVLQAGLNYEMGGFSFYADVKKIWLETEASGTVGGAPARAEVTADPLIAGLGMVYRF